MLLFTPPLTAVEKRGGEGPFLALRPTSRARRDVTAIPSVVRQGLQVSKDAKLKPGLSKSGDEARHRALVLYKAWYKSIPYIGWFEIMV